MVRKRRLKAEKGRQPPCFCVCPFRSHTVTNYTASTGNLDEDKAGEITGILKESARKYGIMSKQKGTVSASDSMCAEADTLKRILSL